MFFKVSAGKTNILCIFWKFVKHFYFNVTSKFEECFFSTDSHFSSASKEFWFNWSARSHQDGRGLKEARVDRRGCVMGIRAVKNNEKSNQVDLAKMKLFWLMEKQIIAASQYNWLLGSLSFVCTPWWP